VKRSANRDTPFTPQHHALVASVRRIILNVANTLKAKYPNERLEDLITLAEDGAMDAAQDYREGTGATFSTFAWPRIWGAAENGVARERRIASLPQRLRAGVTEGWRQALQCAEHQRDTVDPAHDTEADDARRPAEALDAISAAFVIGFSMGQPVDTPEAAARKAEIRAAVATLKDRDDVVVSAYVFDQKSFAQIASELPGDVLPATAQRHYHAAMGRLAKRLAKVAD